MMVSFLIDKLSVANTHETAATETQSIVVPTPSRIFNPVL